MAQMSGAAKVTVQNPSIHHRRASHSGSQCQKHGILHLPGRAAPNFAKQGRLGIIPANAAQEIERQCRIENIDFTKLKAQTERICQNLKAILEAAGTDLESVVKSTVYLRSMADFAAMNEVYGKYFKNEPPARATVAVAGLPRDVQVEIDVIAEAT